MIGRVTKSMRPVLTAPSLALLALTSCALPPVEDDVALGRQVADSMERQVGVYRDPALDSWLRGVAGRLEAQVPGSPFAYRFSVLDQPEPNAFAAPGGFVYVSRGLIALAQSEDEVATVLAHEIVHVEQRHTAKQMAKRSLPGLLAVPGHLLRGPVLGDVGKLISSPFDGLAALRKASYGRSQESESDQIGQSLAARAGYEAAALGAILDRMERFGESLTGETARPSFFDSHPPTPERVDEAAARARELEIAARPPGALDDAAFLRSLDGLVFGANPAQGELRDGVFLHPDLDIALEFPAGWKTFNSAEVVGAVHPDQTSFVLYGAAGTGGAPDADRLAAERRAAMEREAGLRPSVDEVRTLGDGRPAHLLGYSQRSGGETVHLFFVWVPFRGVIHQLLGMATEAERPRIRRTVESLRALSPIERRSFDVLRIRVVEAAAGEKLAELALRTRSAATAPLLAVINGIDAATRLEAGQLIKIVRRETYLPRP
jgi:predicted Zn-dependent protease